MKQYLAVSVETVHNGLLGTDREANYSAFSYFYFGPLIMILLKVILKCSIMWD